MADFCFFVLHLTSCWPSAVARCCQRRHTYYKRKFVFGRFRSAQSRPVAAVHMTGGQTQSRPVATLVNLNHDLYVTVTDMILRFWVNSATSRDPLRSVKKTATGGDFISRRGPKTPSRVDPFLICVLVKVKAFGLPSQSDF